jgi:hypothetical protein
MEVSGAQSIAARRALLALLLPLRLSLNLCV